jgi:hypothetical protein
MRRLNRVAIKAAVAVAIAGLSLAALLPQVSASATTPTTFNGSCTFTGPLTYFPAGYNVPQSAHIDNATGTCTGSLDGAPTASIPVYGYASGQGVFTPVTLEPVAAQGSAAVVFGPNVYLNFVAYYAGSSLTMNVQGGTGLLSGSVTGWAGSTGTVTFSTIGTVSSAHCCSLG